MVIYIPSTIHFVIFLQRHLRQPRKHRENSLQDIYQLQVDKVMQLYETMLTRLLGCSRPDRGKLMA